MNFGIIGTGLVAPHHAKAICQIEGARLAGICSRTPEKAQSFAMQYSTDYCCDYREFVKRKDIDIINICTLPNLHMEIACEAAKNGKHVIIEKPIDLSLKRADTIIEECRRYGVVLSVIFQHRFDDGVIKLKNAIEEKLFGKIIEGDCYVKWFRTDEYYSKPGKARWDVEGGGALINQGIHSIDLLRWMIGPVDRVFGYFITGVTHQIESEDVVAALVKFKNGAMGVIQASTSIYPGYSEILAIHGENGSVILEAGQIKKWDFKNSQKNYDYESSTINIPASGSSSPMATGVDSFVSQFKDVIDAIQNKKEPLVTGWEGRESLRLVLAIYESAKTGKEIVCDKFGAP